jgi:hypothetical protein
VVIVLTEAEKDVLQEVVDCDPEDSVFVGSVDEACVVGDSDEEVVGREVVRLTT